MPEPPKTTLTELPDSRVRLQLQVSAAELEQRVQRRAGRLGRDLKLPGFRRGKVPPALVLQRIGWEAIVDEVVRESVGGWYVEAIEATGIVPVGDPKVDLGELPKRGGELELSVEVGVLPTATLGAYKGVEVGREEVSVDEARVQEEIERLREGLGRLEVAERAAQSGDFAVIDYEGSLLPSSDSTTATTTLPEGALTGRDRLIELGSGKLLPGFEEALLGAQAGEQRTVQVDFPVDHPDGELAGRSGTFELTLKEVKQRELPEVDEDFAIDAGFDSVQEVQDDIRERLAEVERQRIEGEFREAALDAVVAQAQVQTPHELIEARAREMWERMLHSLSHRGVSREVYLQMDGRPEAEIISELEADAERALRREAVLNAIVAAEQIKPTEQELLETLEPIAQERSSDPQKLLEELREAGRLDELREDLAARRAIELIALEAKPIPLDLALAKEKLWTPEDVGRDEQAVVAQGTGETPGGLWTPDR